jgi:hypothetical protein
LFICDHASPPPAPGLFTTTMSWPYLALNTIACRRATVSDSPPGAKGMTYWTVRSGQAAKAADAATAATRQQRRAMEATFIGQLLG